jgi:hypothetical protein
VLTLLSGVFTFLRLALTFQAVQSMVANSFDALSLATRVATNIQPWLAGHVPINLVSLVTFPLTLIFALLTFATVTLTLWSCKRSNLGDFSVYFIIRRVYFLNNGLIFESNSYQTINSHFSGNQCGNIMLGNQCISLRTYLGFQCVHFHKADTYF